MRISTSVAVLGLTCLASVQRVQCYAYSVQQCLDIGEPTINLPNCFYNAPDTVRTLAFMPPYSFGGNMTALSTLGNNSETTIFSIHPVFPYGDATVTLGPTTYEMTTYFGADDSEPSTLSQHCSYTWIAGNGDVSPEELRRMSPSDRWALPDGVRTTRHAVCTGDALIYDHVLSLGDASSTTITFSEPVHQYPAAFWQDWIIYGTGTPKSPLTSEVAALLLETSTTTSSTLASATDNGDWGSEVAAPSAYVTKTGSLGPSTGGGGFLPIYPVETANAISSRIRSNSTSVAEDAQSSKASSGGQIPVTLTGAAAEATAWVYAIVVVAAGAAFAL